MCEVFDQACRAPDISNFLWSHDDGNHVVVIKGMVNASGPC